MDKTGLRSHFKGLREQFKSSGALFEGANQGLNAHVLNLLEELGASARPILTFFGYQSEPKLHFHRSFQWALPKVYPDSSLRFFRYAENDAMEPNRFGILEPQEDEAHEVEGSAAGAVLVPGLAFDSKGHRLGSGKGFYDRFLHPYPRLKRIGVCFSFQFSSERDLPADPWDVPVDWLVTEKGVTRFIRKGS